jgi:hypothetical protein
VVIRYFKIAAPVVDALNTPIAAALSAEEKSAFRAEIDEFPDAGASRRKKPC